MKTERELFVKKYREVFNVDKSLFVNDEGKFTDEFCQSVYEIWQASASREGYKLVPVDLLKRCISHIATAECHPNNSKQDEELMANDMELIEKAMIGASE